MLVRIVVTVVALNAVPIASQTGSGVEVLGALDAAAKANADKAWDHLQKAVRLLEKDRELTESERQAMIGRLAATMREKQVSPPEILRMMGPKAHRRVTRQILYRRYLEHWMFENPIRLWVVVEWRKGQDPTIRWIGPLPAEN